MKLFRTFSKIAILAVLMLSCTPQDRYITITGYAQGGTYAVKLNLNGVNVRPEAIRDSVDSLLSAIDNSVSGYNKNSLLSRYNAGENIVPDDIFTDLCSYGQKFHEETAGVVDVASAKVFDLWGFGFKSGEMPTDEMVAEAMKERDSMKNLNFNAIAQGYSCDLVARYLYSIGVKDMMVDIGEIFCDGMNPSGKPWSLGIDKPVDGNNELGAQIQGIFRAPEGAHGIVTSGNYRKFYIKDGKKYAHSIDPRTGYPVTHNLLSATIVADDAVTADAYATYCMVVGLDEAMDLIEKRTDLEGCLIYDEDGAFKTWCSKGFVLEELPSEGQ